MYVYHMVPEEEGEAAEGERCLVGRFLGGWRGGDDDDDENNFLPASIAVFYMDWTVESELYSSSSLESCSRPHKLQRG